MNGEQKKERLDVLMVNQGLAASRERAKAYIMAGLATVDGQKIDKCGTLVSKSAKVTLLGDNIGYVSRGGLKLVKALTSFSIDLAGKIMVDVGASTGGFADCALKHGAAKIFAIDVGYGQLAWSLRTDARIVNMERTNIRKVTLEDLGERPDFAAIDVAFISLDKVLPVIKAILSPEGEVVALIKPQFEAGRERVGKKGVVKDPLVHQEVILKVLKCAEELSLRPAGLTYSPIKGPEGNIEYLTHLKNAFDDNEDISVIDQQTVAKIVAQAHDDL